MTEPATKSLPRAYKLGVAVAALYAALIAYVAAQGWPEGGLATIEMLRWPVTATALAAYGYDITRIPLPWSPSK